MERTEPLPCPARAEARALARGRLASVGKTLLVLFKVRIVALLLFAAVGGAFVAAGGWPGGGPLGLVLLTGGLAAAGSSALNEYLEREPDGLMQRTRGRRPLVNGAIAHPGWVPFVGTAMIVIPALAVLPGNPALAFFLLLGAAIYVGVYTVWLKPRTLLNIVIGGAAGSAAVLSGAAAAGAWNAPGALLLALLVFLWTPTHFWSLAIVYREDYARGSFPMLPTRTGAGTAAWWVLLHTGGTALAALALGLQRGLSWIYLVPVALATIELLRRNVRLLAEATPRRAMALFIGSNLYLSVVLLMACVDVLIP